MIGVRSGRLCLPLADGRIIWTREDEIAHITTYEDGVCVVMLRTPYFEIDIGGRMLRGSEILVHASADDVLRACFEAREK